ncbi:MAG TPA: A24 family peptidase C-terminal domain-containing protein [Candidatus Bathyarchaeia archaeon]|nr:A24 family peptidase C-terminal domain-containing protein [Candidatus Bathyarchaeia archaeon]
MGFLEVYSIIVPIVAILALLYAGIEDILHREVRKEFIWLLMIGVGIILDILYLILYEGTRVKTDILAEMLLSIVIGFILGFLLFYIGAWGGADSKALWAITILTPLHPFLETRGTLVNLSFPIIEPTIWVLDSSVISILLNSGLLAIFYPLILIILNSINATRGTLFDEVKGSTASKVRCFFFGYRKKVTKINPKKLHYDFLETLLEKSFKGLFEGDYKGRLDGKFIGIIQGSINGEFSGSIYGKLLKNIDKGIEEFDLEEILSQAEKITKGIKIEKEDDEEDIDYVLNKYQEIFTKDKRETSSNDEEQLINFNGRLNIPITSIFIGTIDGIFDGTISGKLLGNIEGYFSGNSSKGKLSGTTAKDGSWIIKMRLGLDEEKAMERRQLRTLWLLQTTNKKTVWVTPGLPFVTLMLFGYILYILFGNFFLFLLRI